MSIAQRFEHDRFPSPPMRGWLGTGEAATSVAAARALWRRTAPLIAATAVRVIPGPFRIITYLFTFAYALLGRHQAIMALVVLWFANMCTHAIGPPPSAAAAFRHLTLIAAALSVLIIHAATPPRTCVPFLAVWTGGLSLLVVMHSAFLSTMPEVSLPKAISFALSFQTLLLAWSRLSPFDRAVTEKQVVGVLCALAVFSIPLVGMKAGYIKNGQGFQGLMEHPQAFGPTMAILAVWLFGIWITDRRMSVMLKAVLLLATVWVFLAQARSGLLIFVLGASAAILSGPLAAATSWTLQRGPKLLKRRLVFLALSFVVLFAVAGPSLYGGLQKFIFSKGRQASSITDAAWQSRGRLITAMQQNIDKYPLRGIGFGVASTPDGYGSVVRDPYFGIVIMAAVEKGVLPIAMVEEMGWPLSLLYGPWFLVLFLKSARGGARYAGVCAAVYTLNFSECLFFSPGGGGLLVQSLIAMAATAQPRARLT